MERLEKALAALPLATLRNFALACAERALVTEETAGEGHSPAVRKALDSAFRFSGDLGVSAEEVREAAYAASLSDFGGTATSAVVTAAYATIDDRSAVVTAAYATIDDRSVVGGRRPTMDVRDAAASAARIAQVCAATCRDLASDTTADSRAAHAAAREVELRWQLNWLEMASK